ncbi:carboxypeptidase regulatory-like domain-containing protein [Microbacterium sp. NPDC079995]|uniref:carboxypeptidase regulatory-like domain-containing protein n=1 Tax=unclassified Microbacterium TaxID=2609290 RepID=UPI0034509818
MLRTRRAATLLTAFLIAVPLTLVSTEASATDTSTVTGHMLGPDGEGIVGQVQVYPVIGRENDPSGNRTIPTDREGAFVLDEMASGDYILEFQTRNKLVLDEYWQDATTWETANILTVQAGEDLPPLIARLDAAGSISGRVVDSDGKTPFASARVQLTPIVEGGGLYSPLTANTAADGTYRITGVKPGDYRLAFVPASPDFRPGVSSLWSGAPDGRLTLGRSEDRVGVNGSAWFIDWLSGNVYHPDGYAQHDVDVTLRYRDGRQFTTTTGGRGQYRFDEVPVGEVTFKFTPRSGIDARPQWYGGSETLSGATWLSTADAVGLRTTLVGTIRTEPSWITGTPAAGRTLTAHANPFLLGITFSYQWHADGKAIAGANKRTFTPNSSTVGKRVTVTVTHKKAGYQSVSRTAPATARVQLVGTPRITGVARVGRILSASPGTWAKGTAFRYQWYANGKAVSKASKKTFTVPVSGRGKKYTVKVTGTQKGFVSMSATSAPTAAARPR